MKAAVASLLLICSVVHAQQPALNCKFGPASKTYGGAPWYVYACDDRRSVVVFSAPGSPAAPFYFLFAFRDGQYRLEGEGTGNKTIAEAAFKELSALGPNDIAALHSEASAMVVK